jgi:hypothetical protein
MKETTKTLFRATFDYLTPQVRGVIEPEGGEVLTRRKLDQNVVLSVSGVTARSAKYEHNKPGGHRNHHSVIVRCVCPCYFGLIFK